MEDTGDVRIAAIAVSLSLMAAACSGPETPQAAEGSSTTEPHVDVSTTVALSEATVAPWQPPAHRITIHEGRFVERATGEVFVPRGVNYVEFAGTDRTVAADSYDHDQTDADFAWLAEHGFNTVRVFMDSCSVGAGCITRTGADGLHGSVLDVIADVMAVAKAHGIVLVLTSNDLPDGGGYREISSRDDEPGVFPGYRNSDFLTASGHDAMATYWDDLLSGLVERQADFDVVLGWSILNEHWLFRDQPPLNLRTGTVTSATGTYDMADADERRSLVVDATREMISRVAAVVRTHDPDGLVTMGFFAPQFPNPTSIGGDWYVDTAPLVAESELDFFDFHAYAGEDIGVAEIAENFGIDDTRPVIMGEVGAFTSRYASVEAAAVALQQTIAESCAVGFDGWLLWAYNPIPLSDRTWAVTEADGQLAQTLGPAGQPDPCHVTLENPNLAATATIRVSSELPGEGPEFVHDGSIDTQWGSGDDAPQWIEFRFDEPASLTALSATVAQWPSGATRHVVTVVAADGSTALVHEIARDTAQGDVLEISFDEPLADITVVRIETLESPSWVAWSEISLK